MADAILTLNAGSSSIKFSLFGMEGSALGLRAHGEIEKMEEAPHFQVRAADGGTLADENWPQEEFSRLVEKIIDWVEAHLNGATLAAIGHRVVHGGAQHHRPERITPDLLRILDRLVPLAPLHQPHNIAPIRAILTHRPELPQIACFDTAFHHTMPAVAARFALPRELEAEGIRRYGFHGLSYEYIARRLRDLAPDLSRGRVIVAHLGNGASLCAMSNGRSIDTTMGFTALDGLVMGTRSGSLDPGVILYLQQERGMGVAEIEDLLYHRSGLLGVSGVASDMRTLLASQDPHATEAIDLFTFRIAREIGALTSSLGGLDMVVFTAGIGEHAPEIRALVCERLGWLGIRLDNAANKQAAPLISAADSQIAVRVVPTDEEAMIARHTLEMIASATGSKTSLLS